MMGEIFDSSKATNDLKQLLNMAQSSQKTVGPKTDQESVSIPAFNYQPQYSSAESTVSANTNQNALSDVAAADAESSSHSHNHKAHPAGRQKHKASQSQEKGRSKDDPKNFHSNTVAKTCQEAEIDADRKNSASVSSSISNGGKSKTKFSPATPMSPKDKNGPRPMNISNMGKQDKGKGIKPNDSHGNNSKNTWENITKDLQIKMEKNKIFFLKKKNPRFPNAKYFCGLCEYHLDSVELCEKHMQEERHSLKMQSYSVEIMLGKIPEPKSDHLEAITAVIEQVYDEHGLKPSDRETRMTIVQRLEAILQEKMPDLRLHMYGTSLTCMGFKTADINVSLSTVEKEGKLTTLLKDSYTVMKDRTDTGFINVYSDFSATIPALLLTDEKTGLKLSVSIHFYSALCTSELLSIYTDFDDRVAKLTVAFRYWAQLCGVDRQQVGFFPPIALDIMVIFFLQSVHPQLLPIVKPPEVSNDTTCDFSKDKPAFKSRRNQVEKKADLHNVTGIGELWLRMIRYYCIELDVPNTVISIRSTHPISRNCKPWNNRKLAVEDPFMQKKNLTRMVGHSYDFWQYALRKLYHYFGLPRGPDGSSQLANFDFPEDDGRKKASAKRKSAGKTVDGQKAAKEDSNGVQDHGGAGCSSDKVTPQNVKLEQQESSIDGRKSVSDADSSCSSSTNVSALLSESQVPAESSFVSPSESQRPFDLDSIDQALNDTLGNTDGTVQNDSTKTPNEASLKVEEGAFLKDVLPSPHKEEKSPTSESRRSEKRPFTVLLPSKSCVYEFSKLNLINNKEPTLICTSCEKEGHHKNDCPDNILPEVLPIQGFTPLHLKALNKVLKNMPAAVGLSDQSLRNREEFLNDLEIFLQSFHHGSKLCLFGSSCNGFGFDRSDMDICMTFSKKPNLGKAFCVERLADFLRTHHNLTNVCSIPTAKVPIVKFTIRDHNIDGDISLYNMLAQENTRLLQCYTKIDPRVQVLGYTIKTFAQVCDIGDASRGSLSSYAYILMMLYYLQQVEPPVIPVLQELYKGPEKPKNVVEGWDAWFMDDLNKLKELWPEGGKNTMSDAELWLGFLRFYVEEFNYKEYVISIRQKEPLARFEKLWNGFCLAIEDPFDLNHNLGSGLSQTMNTFILKTFINGRMLYGSPIDDNMEIFNKYQSASDYFFDAELLSEARPPNDRGCRQCGKIGHMAKHCPMKKEEDHQKNNHQRGPQNHQRNTPTHQQRQPQHHHHQQQHHHHQGLFQNQQRYPNHRMGHNQRWPGHQRNFPQGPMMNMQQVPPSLMQQPKQKYTPSPQQSHGHQRPPKGQSFQQKKQQEAQQVLRQFENDRLRDHHQPAQSHQHTPHNSQHNNVSTQPTPSTASFSTPTMHQSGRHPTAVLPLQLPPSLIPPSHRPNPIPNQPFTPYVHPNHPSRSNHPPNYHYSNMNPGSVSGGVPLQGPHIQYAPYQPSPGGHNLSPVIQNLFASTQGQVMDARTMPPRSMKK